MSSQDCTEIYLIRHAEKDRSDIKNRNPELKDLGKKRALKWVQVFKNIELDKMLPQFLRKITLIFQFTHHQKLITKILSQIILGQKF